MVENFNSLHARLEQVDSLMQEDRFKEHGES